uniref:Association with the SNF1 complex (ASC) domain-containing protein n=1 Tax=Rhizochromulina marina TaxID=1034831 RepID=A0A7S2WI24_9STRA|mmetsp:Transcript_25008/g.73089  ORF Transcript_25008/g.73089 Transcript_25008/m.73089 type:complete len:243 (+) Transcript_25008:108-836(+)|eukprot:CAMPEP_0118974464 /NCGR_PEP_ID=MMETSP1173-20130426/11761_1 /TAXON_ID=1034831 /ORGANISM="Rhizochromulina marina cf, Strain CCMP1243" /LENGTH=242 /DNA_ID=CAMNT_0006924203 /DNA_START=75 /DNA_END=803 /DNA_ORIENTATION=-
MGNFTGKEGVEDQESPDGGGGFDSSRAEPGPPSAFDFTGEAMEVEALEREAAQPHQDLVPTVFRWDHGGRQVFITGTFNNWEKQIPMHRSGNDFTYIHNLKKGKHAYKFIVDDEWRFAPDQPTVADIEGRINNFIDVSDFVAYTGDDNYLATSGISTQDEVFSQVRPELDEYTKEPPQLPPHLRHIILNKVPSVSDTAALPTPQHVALNHLYCTAIKDGMMVLGATQRYREKFVTSIYYSNI